MVIQTKDVTQKIEEEKTFWRLTNLYERLVASSKRDNEFSCSSSAIALRASLKTIPSRTPDSGMTLWMAWYSK
jgi:hypothetical protein